MVQVYAEIGDSDILPEIGELTFRIERILTLLKDEAITRSKPYSVVQQATANLEGWAEASFNMTCLITQDALDSHEREGVTILLRYMMQICDLLEAAVFGLLTDS